MNLKSILVVPALAVVAAANAQIRITEWMYNGSEFVELTNIGTTTVNFTGWSFDDSSRTPGSVSLSGFGDVFGGQSVILSEATAADFRTLWNLAPTVKVIGSNDNNLGASDEINIYNGTTLVDRLTYSNTLGPTTLNISGNILPANFASDTSAGAVLSSNGDTFGSYSVVGGTATAPVTYVANPGKYAPVPEPASIAALGLGAVALIRRRRKA